MPSIITKPSVCPLDCPDTCSLLVDIKDNEIIKVRGSKANPVSDGVVCGKVSKYYPEFIHGSRRLRHPLKRVGKKGSGEFERISWDKAIELCYQGLQKAIDKNGAESILPYNYSGPHGQLASNSMDRRFFNKLGATQLYRSALCAGVRSMAYDSLFDSSTMAMPQVQAEHSDLIILWGVNTTTSYLHFMKTLKKARGKKQNPAKVIVIDPKRIKVAKNADLYLQITPTSDAFFALAMAAEFEKQGMIDRETLKGKVEHVDEYLKHAKKYSCEDLLENCGLEKDQVDQFISLLKNAKRVSMMVGVGLERSRNGGSAIRSAMALPVLLGQFGKLGQGQMGNYGPAFNKTPDKLQDSSLLKEKTRTFNIVDVPDHLLERDVDVPINATFIYNHNPLIMNPDQNKLRKALSQEDLFVIGCDISMTDTMKYADVILPACSHFEHDDVYGAYGHTYLQRAETVISPVGEALPNTEIFRRLSKRFGFDDDAFSCSDHELLEQAFDLESKKGVLNQAIGIPTDQAIAMASDDHIWLSDTSEDYKISLYDKKLESDYSYGFAQFKAIERPHPFVLLTPASFDRSNATFGGVKTETERVEINPKDAEKLNIESDDLVTLSNNKGEVILKALVTDDVAMGVLLSAKGAWCDSSPTGQTVNALIDSKSKTDIGNGAAYYDTYVEIAPVTI